MSGASAWRQHPTPLDICEAMPLPLPLHLPEPPPVPPPVPREVGVDAGSARRLGKSAAAMQRMGAG